MVLNLDFREFIELLNVMKVKLKPMKLSVQYLNDEAGNTQAVQIPISEWKKLVKKMNTYEQTLKIESDLSEALSLVKQMRASKIEKQSLSDFLSKELL